jgi:hypothetical protein
MLNSQNFYEVFIVSFKNSIKINSMISFRTFILTLLIAMTSVMVDLRGSIAYQDDNLSSAPHLKSEWNSDHLAKPDERYSDKTHLIAQDFIPIVIIAETQDRKLNFTHYTDQYNLHRQKEHFLLI